jgi:hypothetical protein
LIPKELKYGLTMETDAMDKSCGMVEMSRGNFALIEVIDSLEAW